MIVWLRLLSLAGYVPLALLAEARQSTLLASLALAALAVLVLAAGLCRPRAAAWLALGAIVALLAALARTPAALTALLLVPAGFTALFGWWFARSLRRGRVPLIRKAIAALYATSPDALSLRYRRYSRGLTAAWAGLLLSMSALNLGLALIATPSGILARFGVVAPVAITVEQWSFVANVVNYGLVAIFAVLEYAVRRLVFPVRPYRNAFDFARKMAALGPAFWRDFFRSEDVGAAP